MGHTAGIRFYVYQNDVRADPFDAIPGNDEIIPTAESAEKTAGCRHDDGLDAPLRQLHNGIGNIPQPPPVRNTNNFFTVKIRKTM